MLCCVGLCSCFSSRHSSRGIRIKGKLTFEDAALQTRVTALQDSLQKGVKRVMFLDAMGVDRQLGKLLQGLLDGAYNKAHEKFVSEVNGMHGAQKNSEKLGISKFCGEALKKEIDFAKVLRESFLESIQCLSVALTESGVSRVDASELTCLCEEMEAIEVATDLTKRIFVKDVYSSAVPAADKKHMGTHIWPKVSQAIHQSLKGFLNEQLQKTCANNDFKTMLEFLAACSHTSDKTVLAIVKSTKTGLKKSLLAISNVSFEQVFKQAIP